MWSRGSSGQMTGMVQQRSPRDSEGKSPRYRRFSWSPCADCPRVGVLTTAPVLGRSRFLPDEIAWSYLTVGDPAPFPSAGHRETNRLRCSAARVLRPATSLQSLDPETSASDEVNHDSERGSEATPFRGTASGS